MEASSFTSFVLRHNHYYNCYGNQYKYDNYRNNDYKHCYCYYLITTVIAAITNLSLFLFYQQQC